MCTCVITYNMTLLASNHCLADQSLLPLWNTTSSLLSEVWDKPVEQGVRPEGVDNTANIELTTPATSEVKYKSEAPRDF